MRRLLLLLTLSLTLHPLHAGPLDEGVEAYRKGDYRLALQRWLPLARAGDADARFNLGLMYAQGKGVAQDHGQALAWYRMAAEQGHAEAQFNLGEAYFNGRGVFASRREARLWWRRSAAQGFPPAQFNLGITYLYGYAVRQDSDKGLALVRTAAEAGYGPAREAMARILSEGLFGVAADPAGARRWQAVTP